MSLTLVRNPAEPVPGLADRGLDALMRLAVDQIGVCLEAISTRPETSADLADSLGSLAGAIRQAAMFAAIADLSPGLETSRVRTRHLQVVDGGCAVTAPVPMPRPVAWRLHPDDVARFAEEGKHCEHRGCLNAQTVNTWRYFWSKSAGRVLLAEHQVCDQHGQEFAVRHHIEIEPPASEPSRRARNAEGNR